MARSRSTLTPEEDRLTIKVLGVPYDTHSSYLRGPALAPPVVRTALNNGSANWCTEDGRDFDPATGADWTDLGDLELPDDVHAATALIRSAAAKAIADGSKLLSIGGDHLVTWPLVQAMADRYDDLTIVHFDAHPDLYDELDGDRYSHACPFARIMEEGKVGRLVQMGIRTMTPHQRKQADRFGVDVLEARDTEASVPALTGPVYVSIDIDVLDPAFAPGMSHFEPGGWSTRQLLVALAQVSAQGVEVVGADLVEINPDRDVHGLTAMVAAKLFRELLGLMLPRSIG